MGTTKQNPEYPVFVDNQVLTADLLNNMVEYFNNQDQNTRLALIGKGILNGLSYACDTTTNSVTIESGLAITSNGSIANFEGGTFNLDNERKKLGNVSLDNILLVIKEEKNTIKNMTCTQTSCDLDPERHCIKYVPALIQKTKDSLQQVTLTPISLNVKLNRLKNICTSINVNVLNTNTRNTFKTNRDKIKNALDVINNKINPNVVSFLHFDINSFNNAISFFTDKTFDMDNMTSNDTEIKFHYLDFLNDMAMAINEFIDFYNEFASTHTLVTQNTWIGNTIVLGSYESYSKNDKYRYNYTQLHKDLRAYDLACAKLKKLYNRIWNLKTAFVKDTVHTNKEIKLIPFDPCAKLGEKVIPYYYDASKIKSEWNPDLADGVEASTFDKYSSSDYEHQNMSVKLLNVQGCYMKDVNATKADIEDLIDLYNLPYKVETLELKKEALQSNNATLLKDFFDYIQKKPSRLSTIDYDFGMNEMKIIFNNNSNFAEKFEKIEKDLMDAILADIKKQGYVGQDKMDKLKDDSLKNVLKDINVSLGKIPAPKVRTRKGTTKTRKS